jgi:pimeloyl-ACP methyl ester carboxylesterase
MLYTSRVAFVPPFEVTGLRDGPPLLLIPPLSRDRAVWGAQLPAFAAELCCAAYDNRGTGADAARDVPSTSIDELAHDALAVLDALEWSDAHIAGWSMGAAVATALALAAPERVRSLSLYTPWGRTDKWLAACFRSLATVAHCGTTAEFEATATWLLLSREFVDSIDDVEGAAAAVASSPGYPSGATLVGQLEASIEHDLRDEAAAISCPTIVIAGEQDQLIPASYARELAAKIPNARLEVLNGPGSTHGLLVERADEFNALALEFIKGVERDL